MADVPQQLTLAVGDEASVRLPGLGTAGYVWEDEVTNGSDVIRVEWSRGWPAGAAPRTAGPSAPETMTITGLQPGRAAVRLFQHRRWESGTAPREEHRIDIIVRPA